MYICLNYICQMVENIHERKNISEIVLDLSRQFVLDSGGVQHDADALSDGLGGKILGELGSDGAAATVGAGYFAPDHLKWNEGKGFDVSTT